MQIFCGGYHSFILNRNNELFACGDNMYGQLGVDYDDISIFSKINLSQKIGQIENIFCGDFFSFLLNEKNELFVCGKNSEGQLGLNDNEEKNQFTEIPWKNGKIKNIICGGDHTFILNDMNELFCCGVNRYGQLGLGNFNDMNRFIKVNLIIGEIKNIVCGKHHDFILNNNNELYACGKNNNGQLGLENFENYNVFTKVDLPEEIGKITQINCGEEYTFLLNEKNKLFICGKFGYCVKKSINKFTKMPINIGEITNIYCMDSSIFIKNKNDDLFVAGSNFYEEKDFLEESTSINKKNKISRINFDIKEIKNIKNIICGGYHAFLLNHTNELFSYGFNDFGQLGQGNYKYMDQFMKVILNDDIIYKEYLDEKLMIDDNANIIL
jgi:alpha-tubulin suppressor-like RCC1 family protein